MSGSLEIPFQNRLFKIRGNADPLSQLRKHHSVDTIQISRSIRRTGADRGIDRKLSRAQPLPDMSETFPGMFQNSLGIRVIPQVLVKCNVFQNIFDFITNLSDCVPDSCKNAYRRSVVFPGASPAGSGVPVSGILESSLSAADSTSAAVAENAVGSSASTSLGVPTDSGVCSSVVCSAEAGVFSFPVVSVDVRSVFSGFSTEESYSVKNKNFTQISRDQDNRSSSAIDRTAILLSR